VGEVDFGGGGIYNGGPLLTINNCTISGNSAPDTGGGGNYTGVGIYNGGDGALIINNSTISGNSAAYGGGIYNDWASGSLIIGNTILKASPILNLQYFVPVTSLGYNMSDDDGGGVLTGPGDQINTAPMLGPLQDNGGPTFTHGLLCGSPAIDAGDPSFTPPPDYDQRGPGFPRVMNGRIDIGSFEVQGTSNSYTAQVQPPINANGSSVFTVRRGACR